MKPIGYSGVDRRPGAFKMAIKQVNSYSNLDVGHLWNRGWSRVDVTDPTNPKVAKFIIGLEKHTVDPDGASRYQRQACAQCQTQCPLFDQLQKSKLSV
jgi:hypothetical protein